MLDPKESRNLKKTSKRLLIFLLIVFVFDVFICFLFFRYTSMSPVPVSYTHLTLPTT